MAKGGFVVHLGLDTRFLTEPAGYCDANFKFDPNKRGGCGKFECIGLCSIRTYLTPQDTRNLILSIQQKFNESLKITPPATYAFVTR